ncbi:MAG: hypothetical protein RLZZ502_957 [Pseudomonadota bacterium]
MLLMAVTGIFLAWYVQKTIYDYDAKQLGNDMVVLEDMARDSRNSEELADLLRSSRNSIHMHSKTSIFVVRGDGQLIFSAFGLPMPQAMQSWLKEAHPSEPFLLEDNSQGAQLMIFKGVRLRSEVKPLYLGLTMNRSDTVNIIRTFYGVAFSITLFASMLAGLLAYSWVRRGLLPLRRVTKTAELITANQLHQKIDLHNVPDEIKRMGAAFNSMLQRLEGSFSRLKDFSADLAHELRTPINNLLGTTQVALARERSIAEYQDVLGSNVEELERLRRMTEDMLFLASTDAAELRLNLKAISMSDVAKKLAEFFEYVAEERNLMIDIEGEAVVLADMNLLERAAQNILVNALRHATEGTVVRCHMGENELEAVFSISNTGPGISHEHLPRLFDRFYRVDTSRTGPLGGSGLGLAIVQSIMRLHNGKATVKSELNHLTTFSLHFPKKTLRN